MKCGKPRIYLVEREVQSEEKLEFLLTGNGAMQVVGRTADEAQAIAQVRHLTPDLVLIDPSLPKSTGIEATREIRRYNPGIKILLHSQDPNHAAQLMEAGANGFISQRSSPEELIAAIASVLMGGICFDQTVWSLFKTRLFSPRENSSLNKEQMLMAPYLIDGLTSKEIADKLSIKLRRVDKIRAKTMKLLNVRNAAALAVKLSRLV